MLRGSNVAVILYCLGFHIFRLFHAIAYVASCQILWFRFNAVKFSWTVVLELCFLEFSLCTFGANAVALIVSAGKWFLFHAARSVPLGRSLNTVAFIGNSFHSIRALQLYITVLKP